MFHRRRVLWVHGWFEAIGHFWCPGGTGQTLQWCGGFFCWTAESRGRHHAPGQRFPFPSAQTIIPDPQTVWSFWTYSELLTSSGNGTDHSRHISKLDPFGSLNECAIFGRSPFPGWGDASIPKVTDLTVGREWLRTCWFSSFGSFFVAASTQHFRFIIERFGNHWSGDVDPCTFEASVAESPGKLVWCQPCRDPGRAATVHE